MLELRNIDEERYFLPDDRIEARNRFLSLLMNPGETWISAYAFTLQALVDEILEADRAGVRVHLLLDHSQAMGHTEAPRIKCLAETLRHGEVTITTAGYGSDAPSAIWHDKSMVVEDPTGCGKPWVWSGSVNFSEGGFSQGNFAVLTRNRALADRHILQFGIHRKWALENEPQYQPKVVVPLGLDGLS